MIGLSVFGTRDFANWAAKIGEKGSTDSDSVRPISMSESE